VTPYAGTKGERHDAVPAGSGPRDGESDEHERGDVGRLNEEMVLAKGVWVFGAPGGRTTASVVRAIRRRADHRGPFVESKEYMAGFWVIEAPDLRTAQEWAPGRARPGPPIEVTPFDA